MESTNETSQPPLHGEVVRTNGYIVTTEYWENGRKVMQTTASTKTFDASYNRVQTLIKEPPLYCFWTKGYVQVKYKRTTNIVDMVTSDGDCEGCKI